MYEAELAKLQIELVKLQACVKHESLTLVIVFEGRDGAGKGDPIKRITETLNPTICRVVALAAPTKREKSPWYFQRYPPICPPQGRWFCSTEADTTAPASNMSWVFARTTSTASSCAVVPSSSAWWFGYSRAKDQMFAHTDIKQAPWYVTDSDDKKRGSRRQSIRAASAIR